MSQIGSILAELREDKGLTQSELAKLFHLSDSSISAFEKGRRLPSVEAILAYTSYFNVSSDYILGLTKDPNPSPELSKEILPGKTLASIITDLKKLRPEQRSALNVIIDNMRFYAEITSKITGENKK